MKQKLLLPNICKKIGWIVLLIGLGLHIYWQSNPESTTSSWPSLPVLKLQFPDSLKGFKFIVENTEIPNTVTGLLILIGLMLVVFSKQKKEDEFIANLRLSSLLWAVLVNYVLLAFAFIFVYGLDFLGIMIYNMFTVLIFFIIRFNYLLYRNTKLVPDEK
ncbi:hypothetical protein [Chitinophaga qingshengii]|uniref:Uncharacterized protein n=1 Tax=Chitinophaga qingshengii TaxID=1569794 RepID=A0ABR7TNX7_9BACT|nr:hypothetical protein [Chitinophaga qingshengii]MBC9932177.1 hypothetical protein [Chitinophaga qingshengii]